jgi:hypothetical protein
VDAAAGDEVEASQAMSIAEFPIPTTTTRRPSKIDGSR